MVHIIINSTILSAAHCLEHDHAEAKYIRFHREYSVHGIFRRHISTEQQKKKKKKKTIKTETNNRIICSSEYSLCSHHSSGVSHHFIASEYPRHSEV